jgi:predicted dehydrogenase
VSGTSLGKVFSRDVEDEVYSTLHFPDGASGQLAVNWSDPSYRRMTTRVTVWGSNGRINADRQECQIYLREQAEGVPDVGTGWTVRYTTELTEPVWFYLRGEEYSAQIDQFVQDMKLRQTESLNSFASALAADRVVELLLRDAESPRASGSAAFPPQPSVPARRGLLASFKRVFSH